MKLYPTIFFQQTSTWIGLDFYFGVFQPRQRQMIVGPQLCTQLVTMRTYTAWIVGALMSKYVCEWRQFLLIIKQVQDFFHFVLSMCFYQNIENTGVVTDVNYFVHLDNHPFEDMWMEEWMKIYVVMTWGVQELCSEVATKPRFIYLFFLRRSRGNFLGLKNGSHKKWLSQKVESHWTTIESHFLGVRATGSQVTFPVWKPLDFIGLKIQLSLTWAVVSFLHFPQFSLT